MPWYCHMWIPVKWLWNTRVKSAIKTMRGHKRSNRMHISLIAEYIPRNIHTICAWSILLFVWYWIGFHNYEYICVCIAYASLGMGSDWSPIRELHERGGHDSGGWMLRQAVLQLRTWWLRLWVHYMYPGQHGWVSGVIIFVTRFYEISTVIFNDSFSKV